MRKIFEHTNEHFSICLCTVEDPVHTGDNIFLSFDGSCENQKWELVTEAEFNNLFIYYSLAALFDDFSHPAINLIHNELLSDEAVWNNGFSSICRSAYDAVITAHNRCGDKDFENSPEEGASWESVVAYAKELPGWPVK